MVCIRQGGTAVGTIDARGVAMRTLTNCISEMVWINPGGCFISLDEHELLCLGEWSLIIKNFLCQHFFPMWN